MSKIAPKFDWYSSVWDNCSLKDVFSYYGDFFDIAEHWSTVYEETKINSFDCIVISCPFGIQVRIDRQSIMSAFPYIGPDEWNQLDPDEVWQRDFNKIKVDFTGAGLDYLRTLFDIDSLIRKKPDLCSPKQMHITRLDVAFDFVDYGSSIVFDLQKFLMDPFRTLMMKRADVVYAGKQQAMKYQIHYGTQMSIYIGSTAADKLLRIYDKRYELEGKDRWDVDHVPYRSDTDAASLPNSWVRFELQLRRGEAHDMLFSDLSYFEMLQYLFDHFAFRAERGGKFIELWTSLFKWDTVKSYFIEKTHFVQSIVPYEKLKKSFIPQYAKSLFLLCCYNNCGFLSLKVAEYMNLLKASHKDSDKHRYNHILLNARMAFGYYKDPPFLSFDDQGHIFFDYTSYSDDGIWYKL